MNNEQVSNPHGSNGDSARDDVLIQGGQYGSTVTLKFKTEGKMVRLRPGKEKPGQRRRPKRLRTVEQEAFRQEEKRRLEHLVGSEGMVERVGP